jgi:hypothetical protein
LSTAACQHTSNDLKRSALYLKEAGDLGREICVVDMTLEQGDEERLDRARHLRLSRWEMILDASGREPLLWTEEG